jgi:hypothetical protein
MVEFADYGIKFYEGMSQGQILKLRVYSIFTRDRWEKGAPQPHG